MLQFGGALRCWGANDFGQASPPSGHFIQVTSGHTYSCGVKIDETVECWGTLTFPPEGLFLQISAGENHACGITKDNTIACWGGGGHLSEAVMNAPAGKFVQVSAGKDFACGLRTNGVVSCWGDDMKGKSSAPTDVQFKQVHQNSSPLLSSPLLSSLPPPPTAPRSLTLFAWSAPAR